MRVILHIGTHKTGTSSVQAVCNAARAELAAQGVLYPEVAPYDRHSILAVPFLHKVPREFGNKFQMNHAAATARAQRYWDSLTSQALGAPELHTLVLSSEHFANVRRPKDLITQIRTIVPWADIKVLCYLRRPDDRYLSGMQQILKGSYNLKWPCRANLLPDLTPWRGLGDLHLREFNRDTLVKGDVVEDFLDFVGVTLTKRPKEVEDDSNISLSAEGMAAMIEYRRAIYPDDNGVFTQNSMQLVRELAAAADEMLPVERPNKARLRPEVKLAALVEAQPRLQQLRDEFDFEFRDPAIYDFDDMRRQLDDTGLRQKGRPKLRDIIDVDEAKLVGLYSTVIDRLLSDPDRLRQISEFAQAKGQNA